MLCRRACFTSCGGLVAARRARPDVRRLLDDNGAAPMYHSYYVCCTLLLLVRVRKALPPADELSLLPWERADRVVRVQ